MVPNNGLGLGFRIRVNRAANLRTAPGANNSCYSSEAEATTKSSFSDLFCAGVKATKAKL